MPSEKLKQVWPEWQIEEKPLGRGAYGVVYKAMRNDNNIQSFAAIKVISIPADESEIDTLRSEGMSISATRTYFENLVTDFTREIQLMESLKGLPNIVDVSDYKVIERTDEMGWDIYIRMELLIPLGKYICDRKLTEQEVIEIGSDICTALEACEKLKIIHRDIKMGNILMNAFGDFKLGDFGIARKLESRSTNLSMKGTYEYMAPEILNHNTHYDARVDIYSLGIVLYTLLNNRRIPFCDPYKQILGHEEREIAVERRRQGEQLPPPCNASPEMADLILRATAFKPVNRFASATEMKNALISVVNGTYRIVPESSTAKTISSHKEEEKSGESVISQDEEDRKIPRFGRKTKKPKKRKKSRRILKIAGVVLVAAVGIFFAIPSDSSYSSEPATSSTSDSSASKPKKYIKVGKKGITSIIEEAEALADKNDYEGALSTIKEGQSTYPDSEDLQKKFDEYTEKINGGETEKETILANAKKLADNGDYASAMEIIEKAQKTNSSDEDYKKAYASYQKSYALNQAKTYADDSDYANAVTTIEEAKKNNSSDADLISAYNTYASDYAEQVVKEADGLLEKNNYSGAIEAVKKGLKTVPDNQTLKDKQSAIEKTKPVSLSTLSAFNGGWEWNNLDPTDPFGNDYSSASNYVVFSNEEWGTVTDQEGSMEEKNGYRQVYAEYHTEKKYNRLTMQLAPYSTIGEEKTAFIQVYADDELVYTSPTIAQKTQAFSGEANIAGAEYIKIIANIAWDYSYEEKRGAMILSDAQLWAN